MKELTRALPDKTLAEKNSICKGGKNAKQRITISLAANGAGNTNNDWESSQYEML